MAKHLYLFVLAAVLGGSAHAQVVRQVTDVREAFSDRPRLTDDGSTAFVISTADLLGSNPHFRWQLYRFDLQSSSVDQITQFPTGVDPNTPAISDDGAKVAFVSHENLTGANPDRGSELFLANGDGTGVVQVTNAGNSGSIGRVELSGDGTRLVFGASFDYTGNNPNGLAQVFVIESDGSNLLQLSPTASGGFFPSISDDGQRVTFADGNIWAVNADGSNLNQLTTWSSSFPTISGNGATVLFLGTGSLPNVSPGWCSGGNQIGAVDWDGANPTKLSGLCLGSSFPGNVYFGDITDDGQTIFYVGQDLFSSVRRVNRDATIETLLSLGGGWPGARCFRIGAAGAGSGIAFTCEGGDMLGTNGDLSQELFSADADGTNLVQRTSTLPGGDSRNPTISLDSNHIIFRSDANLLDEPTQPGLQLYRMASDGAGLQRLTSFASGDPRRPSTTPDGVLTVFYWDDPLSDQNVLYTANSQTGQVTAITAPGENFVSPDIDEAATRIVAVDGWSGMINTMAPDGSGRTALVQGFAPRLNGQGNRFAFSRSGAVYLFEIGLGEFFLGPGGAPDISRAGDLVAYRSDADPFGTNPDGNNEIFLVRLSNFKIKQLTFTEDVQNLQPAISGDGSWVYFNLAASNYGAVDFERVHTTTLVVERVGALSCNLQSSQILPIAPNQDGSLAVFYGGRDCAGGNPDGNYEIYLVDRNTPPVLRLGPSQPTVLSWDAESGPSSYDVIRGEVAQLGVSGPSIGLGTVQCIENDSADNTTLGTEDADVPPPGQTYFYLVRSAPGGTYGVGSSGAPRLPGGADCTP